MMTENSSMGLKNEDHFEIPPQKNRLVYYGLVFLVLFGLAMAIMIPGLRSARPARNRLQCMNNLRNIGLAVLNYHSFYETLPPAYTVDSEGKPLHSWRVLILPFLDQKALYDQIDLTKPWDDPVNEQVRKTFLPIYCCPNQKDAGTQTPYLAIVGEEYAFSPTRPRKLSEIAEGDGLTRTIMLIEAPRDKTVEWMSPQDGGAEAFRELDEKTLTFHLGSVNAAYADGHLGTCGPGIPQKTRRALMTIAGNEEVEDF